eukprot:scaffold121986_cov48-Prasinocladus_malaysianus.AAC.2
MSILASLDRTPWTCFSVCVWPIDADVTAVEAGLQVLISDHSNPITSLAWSPSGSATSPQDPVTPPSGYGD